MTFYSLYRPILFWFQRRFRGFDDSETWSLDYTFIKWFYPRLKRFQEKLLKNPCYPSDKKSFDVWIKEINLQLKRCEAWFKFQNEFIPVEQINWWKEYKFLKKK